MKTAICSQIKNEERYIKEWANYHFDIGVSHIFLFEDYESRSHKDLFKDEPRVTLTTLKKFEIPDYNNTLNQTECYRKFFKICKERNEYDWCLFIDVDEFITFDNGYNLIKIEEEYNDVSALLLSWKNYGANGHIKRPEGGILKNYTKPGQVIESDLLWAKKSLVNIKNCEGMNNIHIFKGAVDIDRNFDPHAPLIYKKMWINHYFTKSWEDFCERIFERGNMSNNYRTLDNFFKCNPELEYLDKELIDFVRNKHCKNTMWLSKKYKLISGGNIETINMIQK